ncbi:MAG: GNAT family N-acetyltransferase [Alcanivorax sp.]|nr:GNAT family N-acetyltransferase [Alcanivorax sp.]
MTVSTAHSPDAVARVLSRAFQQDPLFRHFFPEDRRRADASFFTFRFLVAHARARGVIQTPADALHGAAVWLPSGHMHRSVVDMLRFGAARMVPHQGLGAVRRQIQASDHMQALHDQLIREPHWYLSLLGVDPGQQGRGQATVLLHPMLEQADRKQQICFLDTHNADNVSLYQRFGFRVEHEGIMPNSTVRHWAMRRDPR